MLNLRELIPIYPRENIELYLNFDMISRDSENDTAGVECSMTYTDSYPILKEINEKNNKKYEFGLMISIKDRQNHVEEVIIRLLRRKIYQYFILWQDFLLNTIVQLITQN